MNELKALWQKLLGPLPADEQWELWLTLHAENVVRKGVLQAAAKNLSLGQTMMLDYKIRFASKVMIDQTAKDTQNEIYRERLRAAQEGQ
jgi:hypothetical protein